MRNRENVKYVKLGLTGIAVVAAGLGLFFLIYRADALSGTLGLLGSILRPFIIGAVIAFLVTPLCRKLSGLFGGRREGLANALGLLIAVVIVLAIVLLIVPQLVKSITGIARALPGQAEALRRKVMALLEDKPEVQAELQGYYNQVMGEVRKFMNELAGGKSGELVGKAMRLLGGAATQVFGVVGVLKDLLIGLIVSLYFLSRRTQLAAQAKLVVNGLFKPEWADWIEREVQFADRMFNGFFVGKLLDSAIVGVICFAGCLLMGFGSPLLIAVIVGVTNIIPFFGPFIGALPCALLLLLENPMHCLMFLVFIILLQQLDGNVIGPKILGDSTGLSALWVMFGILLFGGLWGILGMLVGVPLMAVIYDIVRQLTFRGLREHGRGGEIESYNRQFHPAVNPVGGKKGQSK